MDLVEEYKYLGVTPTPHYTRGPKAQLFTRRAATDFTSWENSALSAYTARCWRYACHGLSPASSPVHSSPLWSAGEAASQPGTPANWTNWSRNLTVIGCSQETFKVVVVVVGGRWTIYCPNGRPSIPDRCVDSVIASVRFLLRAITLYNFPLLCDKWILDILSRLSSK